MSKWTPQDDQPALTLAAIRWYAMSLEKLAADLYVTRREQYPAVKAILSAALKELGKMRGHQAGEAQPAPTPTAMSFGEDGCGPGYVNCYGVCLPECDDIAEY